MSIDLGKVSIMPRGPYDESTVYERLDVVTQGYGCYLSLSDDNQGHSVTDTGWWMLLLSADAVIAATVAATADATTATKTATDAAAYAQEKALLAAAQAATANAAAGNATTAAATASSATASSNDAAAKANTATAEARQAAAVALAIADLAAQSAGLSTCSAIPATIVVQDTPTAVVGQSVQLCVSLFPDDANKSLVFSPRSFNADISPAGLVTADTAGDVQVNITPTFNSSLAQTYVIHYRDLEARVGEDGEARTTEAGEAIEC
jgi:hypothetical protein